MQQITTQRVSELRRDRQPTPLVNVLPAEQHRVRHIPQSTNIPLDRDDFVAQVEQLLGDREHPVILYCASETCDASHRAAEKLEAAGFMQVYEYAGGLEAWEAAGHSTARGS